MGTYSNYNPAAAGAPIAGVDKHYGRHASFFSIQMAGSSGSKEFFCWNRISQSGGIDIRENTNAGSSVKQSQMMRLDTPTFEIELNLPYQETGAGGANEIVEYLHAGKIMTGFNIGAKVGESGGVFKPNYLISFGNWIIERSSIEISKDDFTSLRITVRGLGYTGGQNLPAAPPMIATAAAPPTGP